MKMAKKSKEKKRETVRKSDSEMHALKLAIENHLDELIKKIPEAFSEHVQSLHQSGDRTALMSMIYWCAKFGWPLPQWAADAFISASNKVRYAQVGSWDDAFGPPYPKGTQLHRVARKRKSLQIYVRIRGIIEQEGATIDSELFERVGKEFCLAKTQCSDLYYDFKHREDKLRDGGFSHFPPNPENPGNT